MIMITFILVVVGLVALVVALEINHGQSPLATALRNWQTGLSALVGLLGVAVSISIQGAQAERIQTDILNREVAHLAITMQREELDVLRRLRRFEQIRESIVTDPAKPSAVECQVFFARLKNENYKGLGLIEENRAAIGKLPTMLGIHFLDLVMLQRQLDRNIETTSDKDCEDYPSHQFAVFNEDVQNLKTVMDRISGEMAKLPDTGQIKIEY